MRVFVRFDRGYGSLIFLITWKKKHCKNTTIEELGQVGYKYWLNFKAKNEDKIITRRDENFELDRSIWTTYQNFTQIYFRFLDEMDNAQFAIRLEEAS